jgi:hypothetical protein
MPDVLDPRGRHNLAMWRLVAPLGFEFDERCKCLDLDDELGSRLAVLDGQIRQYTLDVLTPRDLTQRPWVLEGYNATIMAYAENEGFPLVAMPCGVYYPRIASSQVPILINFESELEFTGIRIVTEFNITCDLGPGYLQRFLLSCDEGKPLFIHASLTIPPGTFGLITAVDLPDSDHKTVVDPDRNLFTVMLLMRMGTATDVMGDEYFVDQVIDSHPDIYGYDLVDDLSVHSPTMEWTSNKAAKPSLITIGFTVGEDMFGIKVLTLYLPDGYTLNSAKRSDVAILSDSFPKGESREFDLSRLTQITFFVNSYKAIPSGVHSFRFPVYLPQRTTQNFWIISFCKAESCSLSNAELLYPFAGLTIGSGQTSEIPDETGSAGRLACALLFFLLASRA